MRIVISIALAAALMSAGCSGDKKSGPGKKSGGDETSDEPGEQSFADAIKLLCDAPDKISDRNPNSHVLRAMQQLDDKITNKDARDLLSSMASDSTTDTIPKLRAAIEKAGVSQCTMLELLRQVK
jgi:hypothetical protein